MKEFLKKAFFVLLGLFMTIASYSQVTTAALSGKVFEKTEPLPGAIVSAKHEPSGTVYHTATNENGRFNIQGMRTGGPYTIEISLLGFQKYVQTGVVLSLGETSEIDAQMVSADNALNEIVIISDASPFDARKTGAATNFNRQAIENMPTVSRSLFDVTKLTPQAVVSGSGISFAGSNNRYNSFQVDGSVSNDVFGLSGSGTNGGQTGANPISLDAIEQIQVVIAPFDVRQGGFTGGGINAITKSGTNDVHGSVYGYYNNQNFVGSTAGRNVDNRTKLSDQSQKTYGFAIGGPIIKNKLFFFANAERVEQTNPTSYNVGAGSNISKGEADQVVNKLKSLTGGYDGGGYGEQQVPSQSTKLLGRLDWNINEKHKASFRYSYLKASQLVFSNSPNALRLNDNGYTMNNLTNSFVAELNSKFSSKWFNELRINYSRVRDFRAISGEPTPYVKVSLDNLRTIELGSERFSAANRLNQDVWELTDNVSYYTGNHTITFGTHNEFYKLYNLFIRDNFGSYTYNSLADFMAAGTPDEGRDGKNLPYQYDYSFSRQDITGSTTWAPTFRTAQLGAYVQDDWNIQDNFKLTYGLRMDVPVFFDKPAANEAFNQSALARRFEVATDQMPKSTPLFSPRVGFRWNVEKANHTVLRGGAGIFTGRIPFVWIANNFSNTGVEYSRTQILSADMAAANANGFRFQADPNNQFVPSKSLTSEVDVIDKNFKFPQIFRVNLAVDRKLPYGIRGTLEAMYSKNINDIDYKNLIVRENPDFKTINNGGDQRPLYENVNNPATGMPFNREYTNVIYLTNTSQGYSYNVSAKLQKDFDFGMSTMLAYTFSQGKNVNNGTSSQAYSNWQYNYNYQGPNRVEMANSSFFVPHRIVGMVSYKKSYTKNMATSVSLFYNGQSGSAYSLAYRNDLNKDGSSGNDVLYIPTDAELGKMAFKELTTGGKTYSPDDQRQALGDWINANKELRDLKGQYVPRNGLRSVFEHHFDLHISQEFFVNVAGRRNTLQLNFDVLNIGNLLNRGWGIYNNVNYSYTPISVSSVGADGVPVFQFSTPAGDKLYNISDYNSRWRAQVGVRYIF